MLKIGKEGAIAATAKAPRAHRPASGHSGRRYGSGRLLRRRLLAEYVQRGDPFAAARFANVAAALSTLGYGAVAPLPRRVDVEAAITAIERGR